VRVDFAYDGRGLGRDGDVTLYTDRAETGNGRLEHTEPIGFGDEPPTSFVTAILGHLRHVTADSRFTAPSPWIELNAGEDGHGHVRCGSDLTDSTLPPRCWRLGQLLQQAVRAGQRQALFLRLADQLTTRGQLG
jgi:hypothetical protein